MVVVCSHAVQGLDGTAGKEPLVLDVPVELFNEERMGPSRPDSERRELPVFMLDLAACPDGDVALHIFEMR